MLTRHSRARLAWDARPAFTCPAGGRHAHPGVKIDDQFGTITVDVKKPLHLCVPVDKNGEGIPSPGQAAMCYLVRTTPGTPPPQKHLPNTLYTTHQFGSAALEVFGPRELCVPSTILP